MQPLSFSKLPDAILGDISEFVMGNPRQLPLPKKETDTSIFQVNKQTKAAKKEFFKRCQSITIGEKFSQHILQGVADNLPRCTAVTMKEDGEFIDSASFNAFLAKKGQFQTLHLRGLQLIEDAQLRTLIQTQPNLKDLSLDHCSKISNETMQIICQTLTNLHSLSLTLAWGFHRMDKLTPAAFSQLSKLQNLESLTLDVTLDCIDESVIREIAKLKNLKHLYFRDAIPMDATLLGVIANGLESIETLRIIPQLAVEDHDYEYLFQKKQGLKKLGIVDFNCSENGLNVLRHLVNLEELTIQGGPRFTNDALKDIAALPKLKKLHIEACEQITGEGIQKLKEMRPDIDIHYQRLIRGVPNYVPEPIVQEFVEPPMDLPSPVVQGPVEEVHNYEHNQQYLALLYANMLWQNIFGRRMG